MADILDFEIGLIIGILNEKVNQLNGLNNKDRKNNDGEVVQGTAEMLMKM